MPDQFRVGINLTETLRQVLAQQYHAQDDDTDPAGPTRLVDPGDDPDIFASLEAEMTTDAILATLAERRQAERDTVRHLIRQDPGPVALTVEELGLLTSWVNGRYVDSRTAELQAAGADTGRGQGQNALFLADEGDGQPDPAQVPLGPATQLLAALAAQMQQAHYAITSQQD
jgi:hypothetical protein